MLGVPGRRPAQASHAHQGPGPFSPLPSWRPPSRRTSALLLLLLLVALLAAPRSPAASPVDQRPAGSIGCPLCSSGGRTSWGAWHGECLSDAVTGVCPLDTGWPGGEAPAESCAVPAIDDGEDAIRVYPPPADAKAAVVEAFLHAWRGYREYAWGADELAPLSRDGKATFGDLGATIVDALDTAILMGLREVYEEGRAWVAGHLDFDAAKGVVSFFETTIRLLGGLLSVYYLTGDALFLERSVDLGNRLLGAYAASPTGLPLATLNLTSLEAWNPDWGRNLTSLSEATTVQLEMAALSRLSGDARYAAMAERTMDVVLSTPSLMGQRPFFLDTYTLEPSGRYGYGARGDSYYEYLLKRWIQAQALGEGEEVVKKYQENWLLAARGLSTLLVMESAPSGLKFLAELGKGNNSQIPKMDHLACFTPGMLALGARQLGRESAGEYLELAGELVRTCVQFYSRQCTGLSPELVHFLKGPAVGAIEDFTTDSWHHLLRPETVESLYILHEITGDSRYQRWGWDLFCAWEQHSKIPSGGYSGLKDVRIPGSYNNVQESYFLAETLKYLYLLFDESGTVSLERWLFNTEAHLLSIDPDWSEERARDNFEGFMAGDQRAL